MSIESTLRNTQDKRGTGKDTTADAEYKKTFQTVTPNGLADGDINEQAFRDPPQNVPVGQPSTGRGQQYPPVEYEQDEGEADYGAEGPGKGRAKKEDVEREMIGESETST